MRIFVCKYVTGGGIADMPLPRTLQHEGDMTLRALVRDLSAIGGVTLLVARDTRLLSPRLPGTPVPVASRDDCWQVWAEAISAADAVWPVAPETGGLLQRLSQLVIDSGKTLLGCRPKAVRLCGNKLETAAHLAGHGIAVVPTQPLTANVVRNLPDAVGGWVVKPNDGAGAADTYLVTNREALASFQAAAPVHQNWIVQPFRLGAAVSLCLLCRDRDASLLSCNCQHVALASGRFRYQGWTVGGGDARRAAYEPIAKKQLPHRARPVWICWRRSYRRERRASGIGGQSPAHHLICRPARCDCHQPGRTCARPGLDLRPMMIVGAGLAKSPRWHCGIAR